jgi:hypothetical protein
MTTTHGYLAQVATTQFHCPGTDGISKTCRDVVITGTPTPGRTPVTETRPAVRLVVRAGLHGRPVTHFVPVLAASEGHGGYAASGAFVVVDNDAADALGVPAAAYPLHDYSIRDPHND